MKFLVRFCASSGTGIDLIENELIFQFWYEVILHFLQNPFLSLFIHTS